MALFCTRSDSDSLTYTTGTAPTEYVVIFSAWVYTTDGSNTQHFVAAGDPSQATSLISLNLNSSGKLRILHHGYGGFSITVDTGNSWSTSTWHHAYGAYVRSGSNTTVTTVLDGDWANRGTQTSGNPNSMSGQNTEIWVGGLEDSTPAGYVDGYVAEVGMWESVSSAFSQDKVEALAAGYAPTFFNRPDMVFYAPFRGDKNDALNSGRSITERGTPVLGVLHPSIIYPQAAQLGTLAAAAAAGGSIFTPYYYERFLKGAA